MARCVALGVVVSVFRKIPWSPGGWGIIVPWLRRRFPPTRLLRKRPDRSTSALGAASRKRALVALAEDGQQPGCGAAALHSLPGSRRGAAAGRGARTVWPASGRGPGLSSPRCRRRRGAGTRRCGGRRRRGAGSCAGRTAGSRRESGGASESQPGSAERPPEPRQEVSERRESPGVPCRHLSP